MRRQAGHEALNLLGAATKKQTDVVPRFREQERRDRFQWLKDVRDAGLLCRAGEESIGRWVMVLTAPLGRRDNDALVYHSVRTEFLSAKVDGFSDQLRSVIQHDRAFRSLVEIEYFSSHSGTARRHNLAIEAQRSTGAIEKF